MVQTYHKRGKLVDGFRVTEHPSYNSWANMKSRCNDANQPSYENYGGRGISYCAEWEHFENFARDMGVRPSSEYSIERINNDGDYGPGNCKWGTPTEQSLNRRIFKNNTTGATGVVFKRGRYIAQYDEGGKRYPLSGSFPSVEAARDARNHFIFCFKNNLPYEHLLKRGVRCDSSTGVRGVTCHVDGGYIVRVTKDKKRIYLGYFKNLEDAKERVEKWQKENN